MNVEIKSYSERVGLEKIVELLIKQDQVHRIRERLNRFPAKNVKPNEIYKILNCPTCDFSEEVKEKLLILLDQQEESINTEIKMLNNMHEVLYENRIEKSTPTES